MSEAAASIADWKGLGRMEPTSHGRRMSVTRAQQRFVSWTMDVLVYVVVLNLFVEYVDAVVIDSFTISVLTAVLLKLLLDLILPFEHRVHGFFKRRSGAVFRVLGVTSTFAILFLASSRSSRSSTSCSETRSNSVGWSRSYSSSSP